MSPRKLIPEEVEEILLDPRLSPEVAPDYGVSPALVRRIRSGHSYTEVPRPEEMPEWSPGQRRGEGSPVAILRTYQVRLARTLRGEGGWTFREIRDHLVASYGLPESLTIETVRKAVRGISWSHLPGAEPMG